MGDYDGFPPSDIEVEELYLRLRKAKKEVRFLEQLLTRLTVAEHGH